MFTPEVFLLAPLPSLEEVRRERGRRGNKKSGTVWSRSLA
jgi:hypothetical protein